MSAADLDLVVEEVDVHDDAVLAAWYAVHAAAQRHGREETATVWTLPELTVLLRTPTERRWRLLLQGRLRGRAVATSMLVASTTDNLDAAEVQVDVLPDHRGRGTGTALLAATEAAARERGRTLLSAEVAWPHDVHPEGAGHPDVEFALARGYRLGLVDVQRQLRLPADPALLERLAAEAAPHHTAYEVRAWSGVIPDDLVDGWAALAGSLMTEAPTGEMEREEQDFDAGAIREGEAVAAAQGRTKHNAVALDAGGTVVAYTDIASTVHEPGRCYQWGTLVRRDHRGHRLGLAVKVANLQQLARERPDLEVVRTWNAEVNAPMVGVNELLGFQPVERMGELQKRL